MNITDEVKDELNDDIEKFMFEKNYERLFAYYEHLLKCQTNSEHGMKHRLNSFRLHSKISNYLLERLKDK
jgi:hypothetical protein